MNKIDRIEALLLDVTNIIAEIGSPDQCESLERSLSCYWGNADEPDKKPRPEKNACDHCPDGFYYGGTPNSIVHMTLPTQYRHTCNKCSHHKNFEQIFTYPEPQISIPPGWSLIPDKGLFKGRDYVFIEGRWQRARDTLAPNIENKSLEGLSIIIQDIDIDLDNQPEEFVAFAMDADGNWHGYTKGIPTCRYEDGFWDEVNNSLEILIMKSQSPKYSSGWKDSLLVRPEHYKVDTKD